MITHILTPTNLAILRGALLLLLGPWRLPQTGRALWHILDECKEGIAGYAAPDGELTPPHRTPHMVRTVPGPAIKHERTRVTTPR